MDKSVNISCVKVEKTLSGLARIDTLSSTLA